MNQAAKALAALWMLAGCAGTPAAFATRYPDNVEPAVHSLVQRVEAAPPRAVPSIAVGVTAAQRVFAYDLAARRVLWEVPAKSRFAPQLAGSAVILEEGERIIGLDLKTGAPRFQFDATGLHLVGADGIGDACVISLTSGQGTFAKSRVAFVQGTTRAWMHEFSSPVGVPALVGNVVLVPWNNQYLSGLEAGSGEEFARVRIREGVISHAFVSGGKVFVGSQHGIALLSNALIAGNLTTGPHYAPPKEELPGRPLFLADTYSQKPLPAPDSAQSRVRLSWQSEVTPNHQIGLAGHNLYLVFYRFAFALDPETLELRWLHTHEVDLVGARAQGDGVLLADARGQVSYLAGQSGSTLWMEQNGPQTIDMEVPADQSAIGSASGAAVARVDLRKQLAAAAQDADSRLVPVRMLAVQLLAKLPDPEATADLLSLCEDDRTTIGIRKAACNALRERSVGNEHVLHALQRHGSYLAGTAAPPVGALAKAAATQKETRAAPLLVSHLRDPNTPTPGLAELVRALGELGDASAVPALTQFFLLYHADAVDEHLARALALVPDALVHLQGEGARATLTQIAGDPLSIDTAQAAARKSLTDLDAKAKAAEQGAAQPTAADQPAAEAPKPEEPKAPAHITVDIIKKVLLPVHDALQACVRDAKPDAFQVRAVLVVEDGQVLMVSVTPEHLQNCIEPLVRSQQFPLTQLSQRDRVTYFIKRF
jgi:outer membrane protein assembly factor BamB